MPSRKGGGKGKAASNADTAAALVELLTGSSADASAQKQPASGGAKQTNQVGLVYNESDAEHVLVDGLGKSKVHLEVPERTALTWDKLEKSGLCQRCVRVRVREATREEALRCHTAEHCDALNALEHAPPRQVGGWFGKIAAAARPLGESSHGWTRTGSDLFHNSATPRAARLAAGGVIALTDEVCSGRLRSGFAVVRPPGHHACSDRMCGFCFLNSAAMAAKAALEVHGLRRVLLIDWDVHHGNGTQQIFEDDPVSACVHACVRAFVRMCVQMCGFARGCAYACHPPPPSLTTTLSSCRCPSALSLPSLLRFLLLALRSACSTSPCIS